MKKISLDNGANFMNAKEAIDYINRPECVIDFNVIMHYMDHDTREKALFESESDLELLENYLMIAKDNLIIG